MVANFEAGGAAINQLAATFDITLDVVPLHLDEPTGDISSVPAMTEAEFLEAFHQGIMSLRIGSDLVCLGEMGIGNTTPSAAICLNLFGGQAADWTGPGTGVSGEGLNAKTMVVAEAVKTHSGIFDRWHAGAAALGRSGTRSDRRGHLWCAD